MTMLPLPRHRLQRKRCLNAMPTPMMDVSCLPARPPCSDETYQFFLAACDAEAKDADARNFSFSAPKGLSQPERSKFMQMKRFMPRKGLR